MTTPAVRLSHALDEVLAGARRAVEAIHYFGPTDLGGIGPVYWYERFSVLHRTLLDLADLHEAIADKVDRLPDVYGDRLFRHEPQPDARVATRRPGPLGDPLAPNQRRDIDGRRQATGPRVDAGRVPRSARR